MSLRRDNYVQIKKNYTRPLIFSLLYSLLIIFICLLYFRNFFNIDDACNEFLGFFKQYGKIWLSGNIPFITPDLWVGGNGMVELNRGIFLPQNIIASILTYQFEHARFTGIFLAFINISLVTFSGISIARSFNLSKPYAYGLGAFLAINPIFLFQYSAPWWNAASGHAWTMASIATFLLVINTPSIRNISLNFITVISLLCSGWPHGTISYATFCIIFLIFNFKKKTSYKTLLIGSLPSILALICVIPIYSEYLSLHNIITRPIGFNNFDRFLSQPWASVFISFFPSYYDFINYFNGYRILLIPLGFSTIFLPLSIFYTKFNSLNPIDKQKIYFMLTLVIAYFILLQTPSQAGPLRWPFRFLPLFSFSIALLSFYLLDKAKIIINRKRTSLYIFFIFYSFLISIFSAIGPQTLNTSLQLCSLGILLSCPFIFKINHPTLKLLFLLLSAIFSLIIILSGLPSLGKNHLYLPSPKLENKINIEKNLNLDGNVISFTEWRYTEKYTLDTLNSSQFGYYNIRSINGYSPNGHAGLEKLLPYSSSHAMFHPLEGINNLLSTSNYGNACVAELMQISTIVLPHQNFEEKKEKLASCGFTTITPASHGNVYASRNPADTTSWVKNIPFTYPHLPDLKITRQNNNGITLTIPPHSENLTVIFPRVWWPSYHAILNGHPIAISAYKNAILQVKLRKDEYGTLTIYYFPNTWQLTKFFTLAGLLGLIGLLLYIRYTPRRSEERGGINFLFSNKDIKNIKRKIA